MVVIVAALAQLTMLFLGNDPFAAYFMDEGALYFGSKNEILEGNTLRVTELIEVKMKGDKIKYGIGRALPNFSLSPKGEKIPLDYQVSRAERDGKPVEHIEFEKEWGTRVQLWKEDKLLPVGEHQFLLSYKVFGQIQSIEGQFQMRRYVSGRWIYPLVKTHMVFSFPPSTDPKSIKLQPFAVVRHEREKPELEFDYFSVEQKDPLTYEIVRNKPLYPEDEAIVDVIFSKRPL
ncbi:MAG: hypothetical protein KDD64_11465 [Bdellovibrionales bacterium]|nr:hypothetical protein [Bdellovibrionales bacterium]